MKFIKNWLIIMALGILCINCSAQTTAQNDIFGFGENIIGVIVNNKVQFHYPDGNKWIAIPEMDFNR